MATHSPIWEGGVLHLADRVDPNSPTVQESLISKHPEGHGEPHPNYILPTPPKELLPVVFNALDVNTPYHPTFNRFCKAPWLGCAWMAETIHILWSIQWAVSSTGHGSEKIVYHIRKPKANSSLCSLQTHCLGQKPWCPLFRHRGRRSENYCQSCSVHSCSWHPGSLWMRSSLRVEGKFLILKHINPPSASPPCSMIRSSIKTISTFMRSSQINCRPRLSYDSRTKKES